MKESEIDRLLRRQTPLIATRPGLKTRICATLRGTPRKRRFQPAWLALPAVLLVIFVVSRHDPAAGPAAAPEPEVAEVEVAPLPDSLDSAEHLVVGSLEKETEALGRSTRRASRFLFDRLPALSLAD